MKNPAGERRLSMSQWPFQQVGMGLDIVGPFPAAPGRLLLLAAIEAGALVRMEVVHVRKLI